jgi:hypothetical protein
MGHRPEMLLAARPEALASSPDAYRATPAIRLVVLALARSDQGRRVPGGQALSSLAMQTLMAEAMSTQRRSLLTAIVARENLRSLALCERHRLSSQVGYDPLHIRLSGHFERSD